MSFLPCLWSSIRAKIIKYSFQHQEPQTLNSKTNQLLRLSWRQQGWRYRGPKRCKSVRVRCPKKASYWGWTSTNDKRNDGGLTKETVQPLPAPDLSDLPGPCMVRFSLTNARPLQFSVAPHKRPSVVAHQGPGPMLASRSPGFEGRVVTTLRRYAACIAILVFLFFLQIRPATSCNADAAPATKFWCMSKVLRLPRTVHMHSDFHTTIWIHTCRYLTTGKPWEILPWWNRFALQPISCISVQCGDCTIPEKQDPQRDLLGCPKI